MSSKTLAVAFYVLVGTLSACGSHDGMPNPPSELMVSAVDGGGHLTWKDNSDNEASFMIERKVGTGAYETLTSVPFDTTAYHDPNLAAGTYMYRVMAMPKSGEHGGDTKYSNEVSLTVP